MKYLEKILLPTVALLSIVGLFISPTIARGTTEYERPDIRLQISPVSNHVTLEAGKTFEYEMTVENIGATAFSYKVYATPYSVSSDFKLSPSKKKTAYTKIADWISFKNKNGEWVDNYIAKIKPGKKHTVHYRINFPDTLPAGDQYAIIFAELISNNSENASNLNTKTTSRVGLVVAGRNKNHRDEYININIGDISFPGFVTQNKEINTQITIENPSIFGGTEVVSGIVLKDPSNKTVFEKSIATEVIPTESHIIDLVQNQPLDRGIYFATITVRHTSDEPKIFKRAILIW